MRARVHCVSFPSWIEPATKDRNRAERSRVASEASSSSMVASTASMSFWECINSSRRTSAAIHSSHCVETGMEIYITISISHLNVKLIFMSTYSKLVYGNDYGTCRNRGVGVAVHYRHF